MLNVTKYLGKPLSMNNGRNKMSARLDHIDELVIDHEEPQFVDEFYETHPLDIYDDVDIYARLRFKREGIMRITDLIASDIQHETALSPQAHKCVSPYGFSLLDRCKM